MSQTDVSQINRLYEFIFRSSSDGIIILDEQPVILHMNPAAAAMLGITADATIGQNALEIFAKNVNLKALIRDNKERRRDVKLPRKRLAQGIAETLPTGERIILLQDVTERRSIEDRRDMLSKAIAHDLRNPISAISGFADLVSRFGDLTPPQEKYLGRIKQTSAKLHDMVKSLVDLAWIEAGMPLEHVPIRLNEVINAAVNDLNSIAQKQQVGIVASVQMPLPMIMGDPVRMQMVIHNLLHNAIIYSEPESNIAIHAWGDQNEVFCSVGDRGIGISEAENRLIFDRMYRSNDERVREIAGGGLGLTVAKTIVQRHGGDIYANSILGEGSTFMFILPSVDL